MAKRKAKTEGRKRPNRGPNAQNNWLLWFANIVQILLDRFGWPGLLVIVSLGFILKYGTLDQKKRMIDIYFLGDGVENIYPVLIVGIVAILLLFAQRHYYQRRLTTKGDEIDRLSEWKTKHQEKEAGSSLHTTEAGE